jgi:peroxiredoxin
MDKPDHYNYESFGQCDLTAPDFRAVAKVGGKAPQFTLNNVDGEKISLADFVGKKHVLLEFGSIT